MRAVSLLTVALILVAAGLGAKIYFDEKEKSLDYPLHRTITSGDGRTLDVVILGKTPTTLFIERLSDGKEFYLDFAQLSEEDRAFADRLPVNRKVAEPADQETPETTRSNDSYIQSRLDRIDALKSKLAALNNEIGSGSLNSMLLNNRIDERDRTEAEIKELQAAIKQYKYRIRLE